MHANLHLLAVRGRVTLRRLRPETQLAVPSEGETKRPIAAALAPAGVA